MLNIIASKYTSFLLKNYVNVDTTISGISPTKKTICSQNKCPSPRNCHINRQLYQFDVFVEKAKPINTPRSCDAALMSSLQNMLMFLEFSRRKTGHSQSDCFEKIQGSLSVIEDIANNKGIANNVNNIDMILVFNADWQDRKADELFSLLDFMTNTKDSKTSSLGVFELEFMGVSYKIKCLMYPCNEVDSVINAAFSPNGFLATDI